MDRKPKGTPEVPKKIYRHLVKAINLFDEDGDDGGTPFNLLLDQVKYQMRNLVPVRDLNNKVQTAVKDLADAGIIRNLGNKRFTAAKVIMPKASPSSLALTIDASAESNSNSNQRAATGIGVTKSDRNRNLDPNKKRRIRNASSSSLSDEDEVDKHQRHLRTDNRKRIRFSGQQVTLPKARGVDQLDDIEASSSGLNRGDRRPSEIDTDEGNCPDPNPENDISALEVLNYPENMQNTVMAVEDFQQNVDLDSNS